MGVSDAPPLFCSFVILHIDVLQCCRHDNVPIGGKNHCLTFSFAYRCFTVLSSWQRPDWHEKTLVDLLNYHFARLLYCRSTAVFCSFVLSYLDMSLLHIDVLRCCRRGNVPIGGKNHCKIFSLACCNAFV